MILIVTNKADYTADFLILELNRRAIEFARLNTEDFPTSVGLSYTIEPTGVEGCLKLPNKILSLSKIKAVWYRRPVANIPHANVVDDVAREFVVTESQEALNGLWRFLPCFWVSHPDNLRVAESKPYQLVQAGKLGFNIPNTLVTNDSTVVGEFSEVHSGRLVYKPLRHSRLIRGEDVSLIYTNVLQPEHIQRLANVRYSPSLFQPYVTKEFELRVTVVGSSVFAVELHSQEMAEAKDDWRRVDSRQIKHLPHELPNDIKDKCVKLVETLGLAFGAIDLIFTPDKEYVFLEINPNGQWAWIQQMCPEIDIRGALIELLQGGEKQ
jgi:glutathione synthase/RimK-type ligase-like ATP-grasp enzyme